MVFQKDCFPVFSKQNSSGAEEVGNVSMGQKLGEPFHFTPKWRVFVDVQCAKNGNVLIASLSCCPLLSHNPGWTLETILYKWDLLEVEFVLKQPLGCITPFGWQPWIPRIGCLPLTQRRHVHEHVRRSFWLGCANARMLRARFEHQPFASAMLGVVNPAVFQ